MLDHISARLAGELGWNAALRGKPYSANPFTRAALKLEWSQGHNGARVRLALDEAAR